MTMTEEMMRLKEQERQERALRMLANGGVLLAHSKGEVRRVRKMLRRLVPARVSWAVPPGQVFVIDPKALEPMPHWPPPPPPSLDEFRLNYWLGGQR